MVYTCNCGATYAASDVAKFMQHVQQCSGVSKEGEGERAQPAPRGDNQLVRQVQAASLAYKAKNAEVGRIREKAAEKGRQIAARGAVAVGGAGDAVACTESGFQCPICKEVQSNRSNFHRHLMRSHKFSKTAADSERAKLQGDPRATCQYCGVEMLKRQLVTHYKTCGKVPREVPEATTSQDLNVSRDSLVSRAGNLDVREEPELMSDDQFLKGFQKYMEDPMKGNLSGKTPRLYIESVESFFNFWKGERSNFSAGKLGNFGSKVNFIQLPHSEEWEETLGSAASMLEGMSAYLMLINYLRSLNFKALDDGEMDDDMVYRRDRHLERMDRETKQVIKKLRIQVDIERRDKEEEEEELEYQKMLNSPPKKRQRGNDDSDEGSE